MFRSSILAAWSVLFVAAGATTGKDDYTTLVGTIGNDTVAIDRFVRTVNRLEGVVLIRRPHVQTMQYKALLAPEGRFTSMEIVWRDAKGVETRSANISFGTDSIRSQTKDSVSRSYGAPPSLNAIPLPPQPYSANCYSLLEHAAIVLLMAARPPLANLEWINAGASKVEKRSIRRTNGDTVDIDFVAGSVRAVVDSTHRVAWLSIGTAPSVTVVKRSATDVDIAKLTAAFAARDTL